MLAGTDWLLVAMDTGGCGKILGGLASWGAEAPAETIKGIARSHNHLVNKSRSVKRTGQSQGSLPSI
jgi:hypothetical protein